MEISPKETDSIEQTRMMADLARTIDGVIDNAMSLGLSQRDVAIVLESMAATLKSNN